MEEVEVEVLEPKENWQKELAVVAEIRKAKVPVQTIIVNNEQQVVYADAFCLVCPRCNTIIQQFQPGIPEVEIVKALNTSDEKMLNKHLYCKACGQKIQIMRPEPFIDNAEPVSTGDNI